MRDLTTFSISEARNKLENKEFSARDLIHAYLKKMDETRELNAYVLETSDLALAQAQETDKRLAKGEPLRPMEGMPIGIKDLFCTQGIRTTACSKILENYVPPYESKITAQLKTAGAVFLGKLNMDEFAMGSSNIHTVYGPVRNPWRVKGKDCFFVPGGSSGGSAAAVAAGSAIAATGTDTGGSIRQPASFTGIVGLKPTYGRCSRWGVIAYASSLDQAGPMTKTVRDSAIMLGVMAGFDPKDSTSVDIPVPDYETFLTGNLKGLKVGIPLEYRVPGLHPQCEALWCQGMGWLRDAGAEVIEISLPHTQYALPVYYILAPAEASSNLARYDGIRYGFRAPCSSLDELYEKSRDMGFGPEVKRRIMMGTYVLSAGYYDAYYLQAQKLRRLITQDFEKAFEKVDMVLTPTTPTPAFAIGEEPKDPITMYMNDVLTVPTNLAGLPAISVPAGLTEEGLPLGLQMIGPSFQEGVILNAAYAIEQAANFSLNVKQFMART